MTEKTKTYALIRADDTEKIRIAMYDINMRAGMHFTTLPKTVKAEFADKLLVSVMGRPLKAPCECAAIIGLGTAPGPAIAKIREIHPPAHIIIISQHHDVFKGLDSAFKKVE